ncbi:MAG: cytochrome P450 [Solirubrobacteraceae bacterium]
MDNSGLGAAVTLDQLDRAPHPLLARLREREPVAWLPSLDGWLVTRHDLVLTALRDPAAFTVDDPGFTTARVIGPSMLSLDGPAHTQHRAPFLAPFRAGAVRERFAAVAAEAARRLVDELEPEGGGELRRRFAGRLSAAVVARALGLERDEIPALLSWYDAIVTSVNEMSVGGNPTQAGADAYAQLAQRLEVSIGEGGPDSLLADAALNSELTPTQIASGAGVLLFGGIETTEAMIANALLMLLQRPAELARARREPEALEAAIEESLRLEPAAAVLDRYATTDVTLGGARVGRGQLVRLSLAAANRDPALFTAPDEFELDRPPRRHLAFAQGPHVCIGVHLARLETRVGLATLLARLPRLRLAPGTRPEIRGLVFRKPPRLDCLWS